MMRINNVLPFLLSVCALIACTDRSVITEVDGVVGIADARNLKCNPGRAKKGECVMPPPDTTTPPPDTVAPPPPDTTTPPPPDGAVDFAAVLDRWDRNFVDYGVGVHRPYEFSNPSGGLNYYDRASFTALRGDIAWSDLSVQYYLRDIVFGGGPTDTDASMQPHNLLPEGVLMAWERAGRKPHGAPAQTLEWAAYDLVDQGVMDWAYGYWGTDYWHAGGDNWEGRIPERMLLAAILGHTYRLPAPSVRCNPTCATRHGTFPQPATWRDAARHILDGVLPAMDADGLWPHRSIARFMPDGRHVQLNYMVAVLLDALTRYYEEVEADPRIVPVVVRSVDYLWSKQWKGTGFPYYSNDAEAAPDLNLLFVSAWGFAYRHTGDVKYVEQGDVIFQTGVELAWINQVGAWKQFNENYRSAHRYVARRGDPR